MLHYPHLVIPEETFAWIYPLSIQLEPKAVLYPYEVFKQELKDTWEDRLKAKDLQRHGYAEELEDMCLYLSQQYPRMHCFFFFLIDSYEMLNRLGFAKTLVEERKDQMINYPYKILSQNDIKYNLKTEIRKYGQYQYFPDMQDWISAMRTIQFYEIDIKKRISEGYIYRPRRKQKTITIEREQRKKLPK